MSGTFRAARALPRRYTGYSFVVCIIRRTGARVNATRACARLGGGGHRAASGCVIEHAALSDAKRMILSAVQEAINEENGAN